MEKLSQRDTPILTALKKYKDDRIVKFDVPGHKGGRGNTELTGFLGENTMRVDVNSMKPLDNLCHPTSVIREGEVLAAQAFSSAHAFFMVNGTTSSVQSMIMYVCKSGDKVILPRNVHRSVINAMIVCGAVPVYINPGIHTVLGIPLGMSMGDLERAMEEHPDAKAVFVNNPTYYGICSNVKEVVRLAHKRGMLVMADEAHGAHFYFGENIPGAAMKMGADLSAVSMHKTGGSLTQSSFLLAGENINPGYLRQVINLTQTTSGSYLLLASLDTARKNMSLNGQEIVKKTQELAEYARKEVNKIGGFYAFGKELVNGEDFYDFDATKLSIHTRDMGLAGIEVYDILRDEFGIQIEFGDIGNILAIITAGDRAFEMERLISALAEIKRLYSGDKKGLFDHEYINPRVKMSPRKAFYSPKRSLPMGESGGRICGECVMCYPPGIPILAPGEEITREILAYIAYAREKGCLLTGTEDMEIEYINVVEEG